MKHIRKVKEPAREREVVDKITCDLCGAEGIDTGLSEARWTSTMYCVEDTAIRLIEGDVYPEGGQQILTEFHICAKCFKQKLMPWLIEQGANPTTVEEGVDW